MVDSVQEQGSLLNPPIQVIEVEEPIVFRGKAGNRQFKAISKAGDEWLVLYQRTGEARPESCLVQDWEAWCEKRGLRLPPIGERIMRADGTMATVVEYLEGDDGQYVTFSVEKMTDVDRFLKSIKGWDEGRATGYDLGTHAKGFDDEEPTLQFKEAVAQ